MKLGLSLYTYEDTYFRLINNEYLYIFIVKYILLGLETKTIVIWEISNIRTKHYDIIKWKPFPRYWSFVVGIHRSPVNSPDKGPMMRTLMFLWCGSASAVKQTLKWLVIWDSMAFIWRHRNELWNTLIIVLMTWLCDNIQQNSIIMNTWGEDWIWYQPHTLGTPRNQRTRLL